MWIEQLDVRGFKRLAGQFEFSPKLTVIAGGNEAGKSTMHEALTRALFGFSRSECRRTGGESVADRCQPWNSNPFAINALVHAQERRLRIEWDFAEHRVRLIDADSGEDLSGQVSGRRDITLGEFLLTLKLKDFRHACCLGQAEIAAVAHSEDLVVALQRAVEMGASDSGVREAVERLNETLRSEIGVRTNTLAPTAMGRLRRLQERRRELEGLLGEADRLQDEIAERERERRKVEDERESREQELVAVEQAILQRQAAQLAERLDRARDHRGRAEIEVPTGSILEEEIERETTSKLDQIENLEQELAALAPQVAAAEGRVAELEQRRAPLRTELDGLEIYRETDASSADQVRDLVARRAELVESALAPEPQVVPASPQRPLLWVLAAIVALASALAGVAVTPAAFAGLLLALIPAYLATRHESRVQPAIERPEERIRELEGGLVATLDGVDAPPSAVLEQRARAYLTACERQAHWRRLRGEQAELQTQLHAPREPLREQERTEGRLRTSLSELEELYRGIEIDSSDATEARTEFERRRREAREQRERQAAAGEAQEGLHTALAGLTYEQLEREKEEAEARLGAHVAAHGDLSEAVDLRADLGEGQRELGEDINQRDVRLAELRAEISEREERLPAVPGLREEAVAIDTQIARLERAAEAIAIARGALEQSAREAHRAFRPHLKDALNRNLARLTSGRYSEVEIDDELRITVIAPETGRMVPAEQLSRGTQDQIFFVERLEIIDMLDPTTGESPLLLDEPFIHFDARRLPFALELLGEEAEERQVFFFTTNAELAVQAQEAHPEAVLVSLEAPD